MMPVCLQPEPANFDDYEWANFHVNDYFNRDVSADYLRRRSPFVWAEMVR